VLNDKEMQRNGKPKPKKSIVKSSFALDLEDEEPNMHQVPPTKE
jgi:hypothetical protein